MRILALESSAVAASCAIMQDGKLISESFVNIGLTHSQTLLPLTQQALTAANLSVDDIDIFAVAAGPGSFTGIRIGVAAVKGLTFAKSKPCYAVSTLEAMAWSAAIEDTIICPVMDARCMQVYTALFEHKDGQMHRLLEDSAIKTDELCNILSGYSKNVLFIGDGTDKFISTMQQNGIKCFAAPISVRHQHASGVACAAYKAYTDNIPPIKAEQLVPCYLRLSQAERERENKLKGEQKQ